MDPHDKEIVMSPLILTAFALPALVATVPGAPAGILAQRLGLDAAQRAAVQRVLEAHKPALVARGEAWRDARRALVDGCLDPRLSEEQIAQLHARSSEAALEMAQEAHRVVRDLGPILSPEQKLKAQSMLAQARLHIDGLRTLLLAR